MHLYCRPLILYFEFSYRLVLHFALLHFALEKLLHFALNILLHFASMLLHFALVLHYAAILITFCVSITLCGDSYYILC